MPGFEKPPFYRHSEWPRNGVPFTEFYPMLHRYIQDQKHELEQMTEEDGTHVTVEEVALIGHGWGAVHAYALDWLYGEDPTTSVKMKHHRSDYPHIVALGMTGINPSYRTYRNLLCSSTAFFRINQLLSIQLVLECCPGCSAPSVLRRMKAPKPLLKRHIPRGDGKIHKEDAWWGSSEFWLDRQAWDWPTAFCQGLLCPCLFGCKSCAADSCKHTFMSGFQAGLGIDATGFGGHPVHTLDFSQQYHDHRALYGHNLVFYSRASTMFNYKPIIDLLDDDAVEIDSDSHWFFVPESKGGSASAATIADINSKIVEFLGRTH